MRSSKYTRDLLEPLVKKSRSYAELMRRLGLKTTGGNHRLITTRIRHLELDDSHFGGAIRRTIEEIPEDDLLQVVESCTSMAQVLKTYGLDTKGRPFCALQFRLEKLGADTSHFRGQGWSRGETAATNESVATISRKQRLPDDVLFSENSPALGRGSSITKRLLEKGWPYRCAVCGIAEWLGRDLRLHLDHINGIANDNRLENLRLLCPNCHSQTPTYCAKNKGKASRASEPRARYSCYTFVYASVL